MRFIIKWCKSTLIFPKNKRDKAACLSRSKNRPSWGPRQESEFKSSNREYKITMEVIRGQMMTILTPKMMIWWFKKRQRKLKHSILQKSNNLIWWTKKNTISSHWMDLWHRTSRKEPHGKWRPAGFRKLTHLWQMSSLMASHRQFRRTLRHKSMPFWHNSIEICLKSAR